jgi:hypothetical protein
METIDRNELAAAARGFTRENRGKRGRTMLAGLGIATLGLVASGHAGAARVLDEQALVERAELVFEGVVERVDYAFSDDQGGARPRVPHTFVTYHIDRVVRGQAPGDTITLRFIGGRGEQAKFLMVSELPLFDVGDRDVLLVTGNGRSACPLVDCARGRLRIIQGRAFSDEGQALEYDSSDGRLALGAHYDLPEVTTHRVSQTLLVRRDHLEEGEARQAHTSSSGAQLDEAGLIAWLTDVARTAPAVPVAAQSADIAAPFTVGPFRPVHAPAEPAPPAMPEQGRNAQERAELAAMARSHGDPVIRPDAR